MSKKVIKETKVKRVLPVKDAKCDWCGKKVTSVPVKLCSTECEDFYVANG